MWVRPLTEPSTRALLGPDELWYEVTRGEARAMELFILWAEFGEDTPSVYFEISLLRISGKTY